MTNQLRPNKERARIAIVMLWIMTVMNILFVFSEYLAYNTLGTATDELEISAIRQAAVALLHTIVYIITVVTFIQWFRRAYYNLHLVPYSSTKYNDGWAAGCWFVPFLNFFRPYEIMTEMYGKTQRLLSDNQLTSHIGWWWTFWVTGNILGSISFRLSLNEAEAASSVLGILSSLVLIPAGILAVQVIRKYSEMEDRIPEAADQATIKPYVAQ